jgi:hypothetical protein
MLLSEYKSTEGPEATMLLSECTHKCVRVGEIWSWLCLWTRMLVLLVDGDLGV